MAFTYCTNCGEKIDDGEVKCPHCGHVRGQERDYSYGSESYSSGTEQTNGQNEWQGQEYYRQGAPLYRTPNRPPMMRKRPVSKGLIALSIINLLFCCIPSSLIIGIIGISLATSAQLAQTEAEELRKKKTALILNLVSIGINLVVTLCAVINMFTITAIIMEELGAMAMVL